MSRDLRLGFAIISANLLINAGGVFAYNEMRRSAMNRATADRALIQHRLDDAWTQRERLTAATIRACRQ